VTDNGGNGTTTTYVYNALGQEVELNASAGQLEQIFDPQGERVGYYSGANSQWLLGYVPWNGREIANYSWSTWFSFHHNNALGSGWLSNLQTGAVAQDVLYYPWGQFWQDYGEAGRPSPRPSADGHPSVAAATGRGDGGEGGHTDPRLTPWAKFLRPSADGLTSSTNF
jgi:YD repeat-containing protein